ncbi:hypothetical protein LamDB_13610 [Bacillus anthracis]|uniref:Uncharacterized protein n=1 Tax=Bacillus anthracis TaxID=1392 RepID=A0A640L5A5_BACAN|nr:hypothetical protein DB1_05030 [Bacillus anthracis]GEU06257.1 hypothetical protein HG1_17420 [Bacillus anthracis]GEU12602.1 hypothetical protein LaLC_22930 [Bacillus anthracis]GEU19919.1 hypothetical protein LamDB_13610 [Bacillus anthracis]
MKIMLINKKLSFSLTILTFIYLNKRVVHNKSNTENMDTKFTLKNRNLTAYLLKVNIRKTFYSI